jgi:hypothetical protein
MGHIGPQIQLRKGMQTGHRRNQPWRDMFHLERHGAYVSAALVQIQLEGWREQAAQDRRIHLPVGEQ